jgi:prepilin-type N-terminal cleavage/methylation domain-containing protein
MTLRSAGFTIIELMIVVVIIGILVTIVVVSYSGIQSSTRDSSILSDLDTLDGIETQCSLNPGVSPDCNLGVGVYAKAWYSGSGVDSYLKFTPSPGNVIDVVVNSTDYCIRGYNIAATKNTITNSYIKESSDGACALIPASSAAVADSP